MVLMQSCVSSLLYRDGVRFDHGLSKVFEAIVILTENSRLVSQLDRVKLRS